MAVNLISQVEHEFSNDAISTMASFLGETPAKILGALKYAIPAVVGGLYQRTQTTQGASEVLGLLQHGGFDGKASPSTLLKGTGVQDLVKTGGPLVSALFGPRQSGLTDSISSTSGLSKASSASLLAVAGSYIANLVSRVTTTGGLTASSLANLLGAQAPYLASVAPPDLTQQLGLSGLSESTRVGEPARAYGREVEPARAYGAVEERRGLGWLKWVLALLLVPLLLWALTSWRSSSSSSVPEITSKGIVGATRASPALITGTVCGHTINYARSGVEAKLIDFVNEKTRPIDDKTWFTFDRLEFETASANLGPTSSAQVRNIADIMNCYPTLNLKVGGYTDNVGDPAANLTLSQQRADATMQAIVANGISASRLSAEGYGEQFPVASNDSEEGRQRNRRIDLRVTQR
jgi:OmpA-OmpF porin, OOP family